MNDDNLPIRIPSGDIIPVENNIDALIDRFIAVQDIKQRSKDSYRNSLQQYFIWVAKKGMSLQNITRVEILLYKTEMAKQGKSMLTVGAYLTVVRRFYEWAEALKLYPNVAKDIKTPKRKQAFKKEGLQPLQVTELLNHFKKEGSLRDYAIINLMVRTGLRTIEVERLLVGDILFKGGKRVLMIHGKGHDEKDAFVLLTEKAYLPIKEYLATRENVIDKSPVFISMSSNGTMGDAIDSKYISQIAKKGLVAIGLDGKQYTAHSLRHTASVNLLRSGATLEAVSKVLRHASISTTQIYTKSIDDEMRILNNTEGLLDDMY